MATDWGINVSLGSSIDKTPLDLERKEIGDWVKVIDSISFTDMKKSNLWPGDPNLDLKLMVIEVGILSECAWDEHLSINQDLIVINTESKIKFRVSSNHVKLVK